MKIKQDMKKQELLNSIKNKNNPRKRKKYNGGKENDKML